MNKVVIIDNIYISSLLVVEGEGITYQFENGTTAPLEKILIAGGANSIRSRLWVNPVDGYYDLLYNVKLASRMKQAGLKIYIDIHFSDTWADPGHQYPPKGWPTTIDALLITVRNYTQYVTSTFINNGIDVDIISIGNEILNGLLWPLGETPNYNNIGMLLKQASLGVKEGAQKSKKIPKIMIHLPTGSDFGDQEYFYDNILGFKNFTLDDFDVQGVSFYPFYGTSATLKNLASSLTQMADKYGKQIIVSETDWPVACTGGPTLSEPTIPVSVQGQIEWIKDIINILSLIPNSLGIGLFYWEPAWIGNAALGSGCSDNLLFSNPSNKVGIARDSINFYR